MSTTPKYLAHVATVLRKRDTRHEKMLWRVLSARKLGGLWFSRQVPMRGYILDFYCESKTLGIEIDGRGHGSNRGRDAVRDTQIFAATGVTILRFSNEDVENRLEQVVNAIAFKCGLTGFSSFPPIQYQPNRYTKIKINTKSFWHCRNVENSGNVPEISELSVKACEQIVQQAWKPRKTSACHHAIYTSAELAEQMVRNLSKWGIVSSVERCADCQAIYVLEAAWSTK